MTPSNTMSSFDVLEADIDTLSAALTSGSITSVELVAAYLNRIAAYDRRGPRLNSTPVLNPHCFKDAALSDTLRLQTKVSKDVSISPLHGVPFTVKDSFKVAGLTVAAGSPAFADLIASSDAFVVSALRTQNAIVLGKTNMPPMAIGGCQRGVYGRAESPYNPEFLPAAWHSGSSSGSGVAVSASLCAFGLGEETVSSGRSPASNGGLVAYTPSRGVISGRGNWPLFAMRDTVVPHTRSMRDLFHVVDALVREDPTPAGDLWKSQSFVELPSSQSIRPETFTSLAKPGALRGKRLGVPKMYIGKDTEATEPILIRDSIAKLFDQARQKLTELGAECVDVDLPAVSAYEKDRPGAQSLVDRGMLPKEWNQLEINDMVSASWDEFLRINGDKNYPSLADLKVKPCVIHSDPPEAVDTRRATVAHEGQDQILYDYIIDRARSGTSPRKPLDFPQLPEICAGLERARRELFEDWLASSRLDGIVFPANADIAPSNADTDPASSGIAWQNGTVFSNMNHVMRHLGIPSVSVTMGVMEDTGMPVGVTFAGRAYDDVQIMGWAYDYENATKLRTAPESVPELRLGVQDVDVFDASEVAPEMDIALDGEGIIAKRGDVEAKIKVTIKSDMKSTAAKAVLSVQLTVDGTQTFTFTKANPEAQETFETSVDIPASERRGARLQSSLIVATASTTVENEQGIKKKAATNGQFMEVAYRYP